MCVAGVGGGSTVNLECIPWNRVFVEFRSKLSVFDTPSGKTDAKEVSVAAEILRTQIQEFVHSVVPSDTNPPSFACTCDHSRAVLLCCCVAVCDGNTLWLALCRCVGYC